MTDAPETVRCVFISYAHADAAFANALDAALSSYGLNVWKDDKDLEIGDNILKRVYEGIRTSSHFCCIISKASIKSAWVEEELSFAKVRQLSKKNLKIIPVLIDVVEIPDFLQAYLCAHLEDRNLSIKSAEFLRILKAFGTDLTEHHKQVLIGEDRRRLLAACEETGDALRPFHELLLNYQRAEEAIKSAWANRGYDRPRELGGRLQRATMYGSDHAIKHAEQNAAGILEGLRHFARDLGASIERLRAVWSQVDPEHAIENLRVTLSNDLELGAYISKTIAETGDRAGHADWWVGDKLRLWIGDVPRIEGAVEGAMVLLHEWAVFDPADAVE